MNIWLDGLEIEKIREQEDVTHLDFKKNLNEELQNCFARMRESKDDMTAEAAIQTDIEGEQLNNCRVDANR